ncbi:hypothetical protein HK098_002755 [Nowakowskiella sp. JEL0407]|nr:hypothetical protein HK098_002755 [Nowakowskiella sp. JEL0407]
METLSNRRTIASLPTARHQPTKSPQHPSKPFSVSQSIYTTLLSILYKIYLSIWYSIFLIRVYRDGPDSAAWFQLTETQASTESVSPDHKKIVHSTPRTNSAVFARHLGIHTRGLDKVPKHVAVIVKPEYRRFLKYCFGEVVDGDVNLEEVLKEVCRFVCWCFGAGVKCLSVYDKKGIIKRNAVMFESTLKKTQMQFLKDSDSDFVFQVYLSNGKWKSDASPCNELSTTASIHINLISESDGYQEIVDSTKRLAISNSKIDLDVEKFNSILSKDPFPLEPHLVYVFGGPPGSLQLEGYPPWSIRLSEFCVIHGDGKIRYGGFLKGLYQFAHANFRRGT